MDFFNAGNLLTLGIVAVAFLLFRYLDRNNRNISLARMYGKELKDELKKEFGEFTEDKAAEIRNYGVILDVDFKRAEALKKNIEAEISALQKNSVLVNDLNGRIDKYESGLKDLDSWTERVEENLRRIEAESRYVEAVAEKAETAKSRLSEIDRDIAGMRERIQAETGRAVNETSGKILQPIQAAINDLKNTSLEIGRGVEEHREAIRRAEAERKRTLEDDMAVVNGALQKVLSAVAEHSNELESELLREITEAAEKRTDYLRQTLDEKAAEAERSIAGRIADTEKAVEAARESWQAENASLADEQQKYRDGWQQEVSRLDALAVDQRKLWQNILDESDEAIEQYRRAQQSRLEAIESMADDALKLDAELRLHIENARNESASAFAAFTAEMKRNYDGAMEGFSKVTDGIQGKIDGLEKEINTLRGEAYEKVSGNLKEFEELIEANLAKRSENIGYRMDEMRDSFDKRLKELTENIEAECRKIEHECGETLRQKRDSIDAGFDEEITRIKDAFDAIGKNIAAQTGRYEQSIESLEAQLKTSIEEAGKIVENTLKTEISRLELQNADRLKKHERGTEEALLASSAEIEARLNEIKELTSKTYGDVETCKTACAERLSGLDAALEDVRNRHREMTAESEERLSSLRTKIEETSSEAVRQRAEMLSSATEKVKAIENAINEAGKRIDGFFDRTGLIDKTIAIKNDLERKIEDLNANMEKLDLRGAEMAELKNQFEKLRRMEDGLNNRMTQFAIEQQRIERMETNFNRLLQTSQSVEERLRHVTGADDMLQETQIKLRKLGDLMAETEERYQRIEKKKQALDETTDGIEKNFKSLQESEAAAQKLNGDIERISIGIEDMRSAIETLANENDKARETVEKLSTLDQTITHIDERMQNLQKARAWLADLETRLDEKYREVKQQLKLTDSIIKNQDDRIQIEKEGSLPAGIREDVIRLKKRGWSVDDIVKSLKISRAAVELILETATRESR
jgi:DNA repair exonuclease SbcCD ATPase subunit